MADPHETQSNPARPARPYAPARSLSARLLILTIVFVMVAEVMIYAPSIGRFRVSYLQDTISRAYLSMVAVEEAGDTALLDTLKTELLYQTDTYGISIKRSDKRSLMVGDDMPPQVNVSVDLRETGFFSAIMAAFETLSQTENRVLRVVGKAPKSHSVVVEVIVDETPMRREMIDYSTRILTLSIVISLFTACLVFLTLQWLIVRPLQRMTRHIERFRENPEAPTVGAADASRQDEIGVAERELLIMQDELRMALRQKTRLATLGAAMAKINHDLRNTLATAVLASDALAAIKDPEVQRFTPRLMKAVDRAVTLCSQTLNFAREVAPPFKPSRFSLHGLAEEVFQSVLLPEVDAFGDQVGTFDAPDFDAVNDVARDLMISADRDQLIRALHNLVENALQSGATRIAVAGAIRADCVQILVSDNGPGLDDHAREHLFQPFAGSTRKDGTGLGLVIVKDVVQAHRGTVAVLETGPDGTTFELKLPQTKQA